MRHVILTCKFHPDLRWSCKEIAWTPGYGYNRCRSIFFIGVRRSEGKTSKFNEDGSLVKECTCATSDLMIAPEDPAYKNEGSLQQTV